MAEERDGMSRSLDERDGATALEAFAELPEWLAAVMAPERVAEALRRAVPELGGPRFRLTAAVVDRLRAKGAEWHAHCRVALLDDGRPSELVLVGRLLPPGPTPSQDTSVASFGEPGWRCYLPDLRLQLEVEVADAGLPALSTLVDADKAAELLQQSLRNAGYGVDVAGCVPEIVRYKPGSRCTIVYRMDYGAVPGPDPLVVKTHQGDKGRTAWEAMRALWARPVARDGVVTLAEPLAYLPEGRILVQGPVPEERTLKDLAREALTGAATEESAGSLDDLREMLARTAAALAALHGSGARYGRSATWEEELAEVRAVVGRLATTVPHIGTAADPLLSRLEALHSSAPADPLVSAHHDFRPAQVLLDEGRIGFIDFDGACSAEPALDLGRFRAKLRDIGISAFCASGHALAGDPLERHLRLLDELCDDFLTAYQRHAPVTTERVALWESTDLLTGLLHAWTKVLTTRVRPRLAVLRHATNTAPTFATR
jgi:Ser/Thr protein kinase RdoA (MazF antagonist)